MTVKHRNCCGNELVSAAVGRSPDERSALLRAQTSVYCYFDGISMSLPFGSVENYRLASALASQLTGPAGRAVADEGEVFYLETREQLDALFALQRKLKVKRDQA